MGLLVDAKLIDKYKLTIADPIVKEALNKNISSSLLDYKLLNEIAFNKSTNYRKFLFEWIRFQGLFNGHLALEKVNRPPIL